MDGEDAYAHLVLGFSYAAQGRYREAEEAYRKATRFGPDCVNAYLNLGFASAHLRRPREAVEAYQQALMIDPDRVYAHLNLGFAYMELRRYGDAVVALRQALQHQPNFVDSVHAHFHLGVCHLLLGDEGAAREEKKILGRLNIDKAGELSDLIEKYFPAP